MEQENKELKLKLKVLEKLITMGITEKELSHIGANEFWTIYRLGKLSEREGTILLEIAESIGKNKLYSFLLEKKENASEVI